MPGFDPARDPLARVGPFDVLAPLGRGGMGLVFEAVHIEHRVPAAVKLVRAGKEAIPALRAEVRAVAGLDHPNIVRILDHGAVAQSEAERLGFGVAADTPWLAMELATHGTVPRSAMAWGEVRAVLLQVLDALAHAHARGVLHRDLKLGNLLRTRRPEDTEVRVLLTDFGLAHSLDELQDATPAGVSGTPAYMAPEQFRDDRRAFGPWTDLYALGCVAWKLLTGQAPYGSRSMPEAARAHHTQPLPSLDGAGLPPGGADWLRGLLAKEPRARFGCAADAAVALLALDGGPTAPAAAAPTPPPQTLVLAELATVLLAEPTQAAAVPAGGEAPRAAPMAPGWSRAAPPPAPLRWQGAGLRLFGLRRPPSVGRSEARDALWQALGRVHARRRPHGVLLVGPSGAGRSHLGGWLLERAAELGAARPLRIGATEGPEDLARRWLRARGLPDEELPRHLRRLLPAAARPLARALLQAEGAELRLDSLRERHRALAELLTTGRRRPVAVLVDDIASSEDRVALVRDLLDTDQALLAVATVEDAVRSGGTAAAAALEELLASGRLELLALGPLDHTASFAVLDASLPLDPALAGELVDRARGNPGVLVQTLASLVARDVLQPGAAGFHLRPGAVVDLPPALAALWAERLQRALSGCAPDERRALEVLGALGAEVDERVWAAACAELGLAGHHTAAEHLADQRLLARTEAGVLLWAHPTLAEAAARTADRAVHAACATALEPHDPLRAALHRLDAGEPEAALPALRRGFEAGWRRGARTAPATAVEAYGRAVAALDLPAGHPSRVRLSVMRTDLQLLGTRFEAAAATAADAVAEARAGGRPRSLAEALRAELRVARAQGRRDDVLRIAAACLQAAHRAGAAEIVAAVHLERASATARFGELEDALADFELARDAYAQLGDHHGVAKTWLGEGACRGSHGDPDGSVRALQHAIAGFEADGSRWGLAMAHNDLADIRRQRGLVEESRAGYTRSLELFEALGHADAAFPSIGLALILQGEGAHERALPLLDRAAEAFTGRALRPLVRVFRLPSLAHLGAGEAFDSTLDVDGADVLRTGIVDSDLVRALDAAERAAGEQGWTARAEAVRALRGGIRR